MGYEIGPILEYSDQSHKFHYFISKDRGKCKFALKLIRLSTVFNLSQLKFVTTRMHSSRMCTVVCPGGCLPTEGVSAQSARHPPVNRITDACENITLRAVKIPTLPILCLTGKLDYEHFGERAFNRTVQSSCLVLHRVVFGLFALINQDHPKITNPEKL